MRIAGVAAAVLAAFLSICVAGAAAASYVALGDSYAAGPIIPLQIEPYGCLKSDHNYAHLAAPSLEPLALRDPSCSGAETDDMTQTQGVSPGPNPPQFDSLGADTTLVTLLIGGNDIGFSGIGEECFSTSPNGPSCEEKFTVDGRDEVSDRIAETAPKVAGVIQGVRSRAPAARILVLNYPAIFPDSGPGCWALLPVSNASVPWLREKHKELNAMIAAQAAANGATLVDWYRASIGHDACKLPVIRWVEPLVPVSPAAPVHPNLIGMQAAAKLVAAAAR
jgi:lysophospholipase L1-like esterase